MCHIFNQSNMLYINLDFLCCFTSYSRCQPKVFLCQHWSACAWSFWESCAATSTTSISAFSLAALPQRPPLHVHPSPRRSDNMPLTMIACHFFCRPEYCRRQFRICLSFPLRSYGLKKLSVIIGTVRCFVKVVLLKSLSDDTFHSLLVFQSSGSCSFQEQQRILALFELSHDFKQQHYLTGLLLTELGAALDIESEG